MAFGGILLYFSLLGANGCMAQVTHQTSVVRVRAVDVSNVLSRPQHRFLDAQPARLRFGSIGTAVTSLPRSCACAVLHDGRRMPLLVWLNLIMAGMVIWR